MKANAIEIIARGVCVQDGRMLLCHGKGAANTYLPGGHIEFAESAATSLGRELVEELGVKARVGRFLGAVEHTYWRKEQICEVNLVFEFQAAGLDPRHAPPSREGHIEFLWVPLNGLRKAKLEPAPLGTLLPQWVRTRKASPAWASTYGNPARGTRNAE